VEWVRIRAKMCSMSDHFWWMFCFHDWKAKQVYTRHEPCANQGWAGEVKILEGVRYAKTDILYACACGKVKVVTVRGTWKLEEIL